MGQTDSQGLGLTPGGPRCHIAGIWHHAACAYVASSLAVPQMSRWKAQAEQSSKAVAEARTEVLARKKELDHTNHKLNRLMETLAAGDHVGSVLLDEIGMQLNRAQQQSDWDKKASGGGATVAWLDRNLALEGRSSTDCCPTRDRIGIGTASVGGHSDGATCDPVCFPQLAKQHRASMAPAPALVAPPRMPMLNGGEAAGQR